MSICCFTNAYLLTSYIFIPGHPYSLTFEAVPDSLIQTGRLILWRKKIFSITAPTGIVFAKINEIVHNADSHFLEYCKNSYGHG